MNHIINPQSLFTPVGFSYGVGSDGGKIVWLGGHISFDQNGFISHKDDILEQFRQTLSNLQVTVTSSGGKMTDIVKMTIYLTNKRLYKNNLKALGAIYREFFGKHYPAMTLVEVSSLFEEDAMIEIDAIAVLPS